MSVIAIKCKGDITMLKNFVGNNPYLFDCPWCGASKGTPCKDLNNIEYIDGSYHRARLMKDCLEYQLKV